MWSSAGVMDNGDGIVMHAHCDAPTATQKQIAYYLPFE
jgi:hypothetical protein